MLTRLRTYLDRWLVNGYTVGPEGLALFRIAFAVVMLVVLLPRYGWIGGYPRAFWHPPLGPMRLLAGFPPSYVTHAIDAALAVSLVAIAIGYRTRAASFALALLIVVGDGLKFSFGVIGHLVALPLTPALMALAGWGSTWSVDASRGRRDRVQTWPITLLLVSAGVVMLTSGVPKLAGGWLDPRTHAVLGWSLRPTPARVVHVQDALVAMPAWSLEALDWLTILFEVGFLCALFLPSAGRAWIAAATGFHLAIVVAMGIPFTPMLVAYAVLLPWDGLARSLTPVRGTRPLAGALTRNPLPAVAALGTAAAAVHVSIGPPLAAALDAWLGARNGAELVVHTLGAICGAAYLGWAVVRPRRRVPA